MTATRTLLRAAAEALWKRPELRNWRESIVYYSGLVVSLVVPLGLLQLAGVGTIAFVSVALATGSLFALGWAAWVHLGRGRCPRRASRPLTEQV